MLGAPGDMFPGTIASCMHTRAMAALEPIEATPIERLSREPQLFSSFTGAVAD